MIIKVTQYRCHAAGMAFTLGLEPRQNFGFKPQSHRNLARLDLINSRVRPKFIGQSRDVGIIYIRVTLGLQPRQPLGRKRLRLTQVFGYNSQYPGFILRLAASLPSSHSNIMK